MEHNNGSSEGRETLYIAGGLALMVLGAGLIMSHSGIRQAVAAGLSGVLPDLQGKFGPDLTALGPDIQRYLNIRAM
jgi:hypothetical protein